MNKVRALASGELVRMGRRYLDILKSSNNQLSLKWENQQAGWVRELGVEKEADFEEEFAKRVHSLSELGEEGLDDMFKLIRNINGRIAILDRLCFERSVTTEANGISVQISTAPAIFPIPSKQAAFNSNATLNNNITSINNSINNLDGKNSNAFQSPRRVEGVKYFELPYLFQYQIVITSTCDRAMPAILTSREWKVFHSSRSHAQSISGPG